MEATTIRGFPLSAAQKRLWQLQQSSDAYTIQATIAIAGDLDRDVLRRAVEQIVRRHDILRARFRRLQGMSVPVMEIGEGEEFVWEQGDGSDPLPAKDLLQCQLSPNANQDFRLYVKLPALRADAKTLDGFLLELSRTYQACLGERETPPTAIQYPQYAEWHNQLLTEDDEDAQSAAEYWQQQLAAFANFRLPLQKRTAEGMPGFDPDARTATLSPDVADQIRACAATYQVSETAILLACWQTFLWRLTGNTRLALGIERDRRDEEPLQETLGPIAAWLPLSSSVDAHWSFWEVAERAEKDLAEMELWQDSFVPERNFVFPVGFAFRQQPAPQSAAGVSFTLLDCCSYIEPFALQLVCTQQTDTFTLALHYDRNTYDGELVELWLRQVKTLVASTAAHPEATLDRLSMLDSHHRQQVLLAWNQTETDFTPERSLHEQFERQARQTPNHTAIAFEGSSTSYADLDKRANQIAHFLQRQGVGPEMGVGLWLPRSLDAIAAMLGILKAGGAYIPLDPALPAQQVVLRLQQAGSLLLLSQTDLLTTAAIEGIRSIDLDASKTSIETESQQAPAPTAASHNLAYIMFTSGSTGQPKGIAVEHRQLHNYVCAIANRLHLPEHANYATVSSLAADLGNTNVFAALCRGGCLHVISQECATDPEAFAEYSDRHEIDCLKIVPSHFYALLSASHPESIIPKQLIFGGEPLSWSLVEQIRHYAPNCQIFNHYGPTETTVGVLTYSVSDGLKDQCHRYHREAAFGAETVPIGYPLANTQAYILDKYQEPVPVGIPGELYLGGNQLARGYINQESETAARFVRLQWAPTRLYRTGDLARYLPDGSIEFLGRADDQIQMRGFRLEPAEIERTLQEHTQIDETCVRCRQDDRGNKRLVAYVAYRQHQQKLDNEELRQFLQPSLPEYAIPTAFVPLRALPRLPNGKIDRRTLDTYQETSTVRPPYTAPRNAIEGTIADIWQQVLDVEDIGIYENFFDVGGDSIVSIQIAAKMNQVGLQVAPKQFFEHPNIADLAAVVEPTPAFANQQETATPEVPLTPQQYWLWHQSSASMEYQVTILELEAGTKPSVLEEALQRLYRDCDALRLQWRVENADKPQVVVPPERGSGIPFRCIDASEVPEQKQESRLQEIAAEVRNGRIVQQTESHFQAVLVQFGRSNRLLLASHPLAVDTTSWDILAEELQRTYKQLCRGKTTLPPSHTASFQQWSAALRNYPHSHHRQRDRAYWLHEFASEVKRFSIEGPKGANPDSTGHCIEISLSKHQTQQLLDETTTAYRAQLRELWLAALAQALRSVLGTVLLVDLENNVREAIATGGDAARTVGCCNARFPLLLPLNREQPQEVLTTVKERLRRIPNQGIGYGLWRYTHPDEETQVLAELPQAPAICRFCDRRSTQLQQLLPPSWGCWGGYALATEAIVGGDRLQMRWFYQPQCYQQQVVEQVARHCLETLQSLVATRGDAAASGYTTSDFPNAPVNQHDLQRFLTRFNQQQRSQDS